MFKFSAKKITPEFSNEFIELSNMFANIFLLNVCFKGLSCFAVVSIFPSSCYQSISLKIVLEYAQLTYCLVIGRTLS